MRVSRASKPFDPDWTSTKARRLQYARWLISRNGSRGDSGEAENTDSKGRVKRDLESYK